MKEKFQTFAQLCTRSLADDPALRLEVGQELEDHLEDACEEEQSEGKNESEAEDQAKKRFGEPEELAQSLLEANRRKLKLRARLRLAVKVALIPAILIGLALCIDVRTLAGLSMLLGPDNYFAPPNSWQEKLFLTVADHDMGHLPEKDQEFVRNFLEGWRPNKKHQEKERYEMDPESRVFTANYALSQIPAENNYWTEKDRANYLKLLEHGRRIDPDNALYDYLEADFVMRPALKWEKKTYGIGPKKKTDWQYIVENRAAFDHGMKLYLAALDKPFVKTYSMNVPSEVCRLLNPRNDYFGLLERISIYGNTNLPFLAQIRSINRRSIAYGEILLKEGKTAEAEKYLHSWRKFVPQQQKDNSNLLIGVLVNGSCLKAYLSSALEHGDAVEAEKLNRVCAVHEKWKAKKDLDNNNIGKHGGILSGMFLPALKEKIPVQEFEPERKLSYLVLDLFGLAVLSVLLAAAILTLTIAVLVARFKGHRPFLLLLPKKSYLRVLIWGIIVPIAAFLLYTHIDAFGGRSLAPQQNLPRLVAGLAGIALLFPLIFELVYWRELRKQGKRLGFQKGGLPFATAGLNMLCGFAALLLITGCVLRPLLAWECRHYIASDELFRTDFGFTQVETQVANQLNAKLADAIATADQEP